MILFPAIDLKDGACVRLARGDFNAATLYEPDPIKQAKAFEAAGARWLHLVDLDGAKAGAIQQLPLIAAIAGATNLKIQVGGGVRSEADIAALLQAGASRVVIGSVAVNDPALTRAWLQKFGGEKIVLALDVRLDPSGVPEALTRGWQESSARSLWQVLDAYHGAGLQTILCTDIARDGMMVGANTALYAAILQKRSDLALLASGGVHNLDDLRTLTAQGLTGAIIGKALYEGAIDLKAALAVLEGI